MKTRCYLCWMLGIILSCLYQMSCSETAPPTSTDVADRGAAAKEEAMNQAAANKAATLEKAETGKKEAAIKETVIDEPVPFHNSLTPEQIAEGWISLFDGHSLFGWESANAEVDWKVIDGAITSTSGPIGLLCTTVPFANYELQCDFRFETGGNSGLFLRTIAAPQDVKADCYELNLADEHAEGYTTGSLVSHQPTDWSIAASGEWHTFHVVCDGDTITVKLDGTSVLNFTDKEPVARTSGLIGLQHNKGTVVFKNLLLKPIGMTDLFNGTDTAGWREVPGSKSVFAVEDGTIHVTNGPGFLETEETYGDFIFQADAIVNGTELNSGYFFRAIAGTEEAPSNGYELQIHNGVKDGDRNKPANAGTGAIFRRVEARRVVADDNAWFTSTLVASGPRIAVWVDGYQVADWEDTRKPDENPRRGLRLEAGHISLQGHDPTTDLSFRRLKIVELPKTK